MHILEATAEKIDRVVLLPPALAAWVVFFYYSHLKSEDEMSMLLKDQPELTEAYEKWQQFNKDERLRALDEAHQRYLHDLATDIEAAHQKGRVEERNFWVNDKIETLSRNVLQILTRRLGNVSPAVRDKLHAIHDINILGQLTEVAWDCQSLAEFEQALDK